MKKGRLTNRDVHLFYVFFLLCVCSCFTSFSIVQVLYSALLWFSQWQQQQQQQVIGVVTTTASHHTRASVKCLWCFLFGLCGDSSGASFHFNPHPRIHRMIHRLMAYKWLVTNVHERNTMTMCKNVHRLHCETMIKHKINPFLFLPFCKVLRLSLFVCVCLFAVLCCQDECQLFSRSHSILCVQNESILSIIMHLVFSQHFYFSPFALVHETLFSFSTSFSLSIRHLFYWKMAKVQFVCVIVLLAWTSCPFKCNIFGGKWAQTAKQMRFPQRTMAQVWAMC